MPATTDLWVQQQHSQPLFVVTAPANDDLLAMLRRQVLPEVRRLVGVCRVTPCFDREGWSPKFFQECHADGFDLLTYGPRGRLLLDRSDLESPRPPAAEDFLPELAPQEGHPP
jgi:hypothetical protein